MYVRYVRYVRYLRMLCMFGMLDLYVCMCVYGCMLGMLGM